MKEISIKNNLTIFITINLLLVIYYLYLKHTVGNDSSVSEWLINYSVQVN